MNKIRVILDDADSLTITWDALNNSSKYYLQGRNTIFNYETLLETDKLELTIKKDEFKDYNKFKILYILDSSGKEIILDATEEFELYNNSLSIYNPIEYKIDAVKSYNGISISLITKELYNKYYLYEKVDDSYKLLIVSEDFQFTSNLIKENKTYMIEAYKKEDNKEILAIKSNEFICKFKEFDIKETLLSIVVPVYNGADFLPRTLDSVLLSTFNNFELILVNDGSKDDTQKILDWYKDNYDFIKVVISKENMGLSYSRNYGRDNATTGYLAFLDGDDLVHPYMYELLYNSIIDADGDVAIAKTYVIDKEFDGYYVLNVNEKKKNYLTYDYKKMFYEAEHNTFDNIFFVAVWNKIVKKEKIDKVDHPVGYYYEDSAFTPSLYSYCDKFVFVPDAIYVWDKRRQSTIGTFSNSYSKLSFHDIINKYYDAIAYPLEASNKDKYDYIVYSTIKTLLNYYDSIKQNENNDPDIKEYAYKIAKIVKDNNIVNNPVIKEDNPFYLRILEFMVAHK